MRRVLQHPAPVFRNLRQKTMSTKQSAAREPDETAQKRAQAEQFSFDVDAPGLIKVTNESHKNPAAHQYTVSIDDVTHELMACTCPHHVHRDAYCKHMTAVENATDGTFNAFPSDDERISGSYTGYDTYGTVDHTFWKCEDCGADATRKGALTDCRTNPVSLFYLCHAKQRCPMLPSER
jgi:hypothetical protein